MADGLQGKANVLAVQRGGDALRLPPLRQLRGQRGRAIRRAVRQGGEEGVRSKPHQQIAAPELPVQQPKKIPTWVLWMLISLGLAAIAAVLWMVL